MVVRRGRRSGRRVWVVGSIAAAVALAVALSLFQPWKLVVDDVVDEAAPTALAAIDSPSVPRPAASTATGRPGAGRPPVAQASTPAAGARVLVAGEFISHEHGTIGRARVIALPDGRRLLRIDDLDTSNGPDLRVWLSDAPVVAGRAGWHVFDDGQYVELGRLKGNKGSQNYAVPASVDLDRLSSLTIWCDRFNVSFGAAALTA